MNQTALAALFLADSVALSALRAVRKIGLSEAYLAAGFVRNKVWDSFYHPPLNMPEADLDVVYFDADHADKNIDCLIEKELSELCSGHEWQVRNQAHMHHFGGHSPFQSLPHALMHWAETATAVGVRLLPDDTLDFIAPFGFDDLFAHILRITPIMKAHDPAGFEQRLAGKGWQKRWPDMRVIR
ncbi:nucleotidyltransferase family protein [Kordiimonas pumila]|uniref:Nucleotidyltransferase family protein n=1 Tax=Kordiimonas pumila TaxID=2161677 RepID=A0ABV7D0E4_9PROT|nr:nucleotidyltransferase family protein [Kordiimonas pumila]